MTHSCQARILTTQFTIPGTADFCFNTTECRKPAAHKITIDDGDAFMPICKECFARFKTKAAKTGNTWYGWFDCDYPPQAPIKGSKWYHEKVKEGKANPVPASATQVKEEDPIQPLTESIAKMTITPPPLKTDIETITESLASLKLVTSEKQDVEAQIQVIEAWMKGEGKLKFKEQPKKLRELMALRAKLKLLK